MDNKVTKVSVTIFVYVESARIFPKFVQNLEKIELKRTLCQAITYVSTLDYQMSIAYQITIALSKFKQIDNSSPFLGKVLSH